MCSGPGSAGRQRDRRCAADILLILPLLFFPPSSSFLCFCFASVSSLAPPSFLKSRSAHHISHILLPRAPLTPGPGSDRTFLIRAFIRRVYSFKFGGGGGFRPVEAARARLWKWRNKDGEMFLKRGKLLDSCAFVLARPFQQIPSRPFFCIALTFSQLRTLLFPSLSFFSTPFSFLLSGAFFFFLTFFYDPLSLPGPPCPLLSPLLCKEPAPILSRTPPHSPSASRSVFALDFSLGPQNLSFGGCCDPIFYSWRGVAAT